MKTTLRGLTWQNPRGYDPLIATAKAWGETHPDVEIHWEQLPWIAFEHRLIDSLQGRAEPYDLVMLDHPWLGSIVAGGHLRSWNEMADDAYIQELFQRTVAPSAASYAADGRQWALPVDAACHAGLIRRDLLDPADLPTDWNAIASWAMDRPTPPGAYPLVLSVSSVLGNCLFLALMEAQETPAYRDPDDPTCDPDAATHVLETIVELLRFTPPGSTRWGPWDIFEHMANHDDVAYCPQIFGYVNYFNHQAKRRFRIVGCPSFDGRPARPILGGVGLAVTRLSRFPGEAAAYARFVMSEQAQRDIVPRRSGQPATIAAWRDPELNRRADGFYFDLLPLMERSFVRPRYAGFHDIELRNAAVLQRLWDGQASIGQTVQALARPCVAL